MLLINKLQSKVNQLQNDVSVVREQLNELSALKFQLETLVGKLSPLPTPAREKWIRSTCPAWERETLQIPAVLDPPPVRRVSKHLALLDAPYSDVIAHVHICINGSRQYAYTYDANWHTILKYTGWLVGDKLLELLAASKGINWKEVGPGTFEWDEAFLRQAI